ncbi:MAG: RNA polymerase sigma factor [Luteibaculaceae bacterium]
MSANRDLQLLQQYCKGDNNALADIFKFYYSYMVFVSYKICRDTEQSKDIIGELFALLLEFDPKERETKFGKYKGQLRLLLTVFVKNKTIDHLRVNNRRAEIIAENIQFMSFGNQTILDNYFFGESLDYMLDTLSGQEKTFFDLYLQGYTYIEIAKDYNLTPGYVSNVLTKSKKKLKEAHEKFDT